MTDTRWAGSPVEHQARSTSASNIAGHFCGQWQPHAAHTWTTPPAFGSITFIGTYQCAGYQPSPTPPTEAAPTSAAPVARGEHDE